MWYTGRRENLVIEWEGEAKGKINRESKVLSQDVDSSRMEGLGSGGSNKFNFQYVNKVMAGQLGGSMQLCWLSGNLCSFPHTIFSLFSYPFLYSLLANLCSFCKTQFRSPNTICYAPASQPVLDVPLVLSNEVLIKPPPEYSSPYIRITCCLFPSEDWELSSTKQSAYITHRRQLISYLLNDAT